MVLLILRPAYGHPVDLETTTSTETPLMALNSWFCPTEPLICQISSVCRYQEAFSSTYIYGSGLPYIRGESLLSAAPKAKPKSSFSSLAAGPNLTLPTAAQTVVKQESETTVTSTSSAPRPQSTDSRPDLTYQTLLTFTPWLR